LDGTTHDLIETINVDIGPITPVYDFKNKNLYVTDFGDNDSPNNKVSIIAISEENPPLPPLDSACTDQGSSNKIITGTEQPDTLIGTNGKNVIKGLGSDDRIHGCDKNDVLYGGSGNDGIAGGSGKDLMYGNNGNDFLSGGLDNDVLDAGSGNDVMTGGPGEDFFKCGDGLDTIIDFNARVDIKSADCEDF
jgi:Ca2+-binding RTX toxin-like protein